MSSPKLRRRSSSVTAALQQIPLNEHAAAHAHAHAHGHTQPMKTTPALTPLTPAPARARPRQRDGLPDRYRSLGFVQDVRTGRWMLVPGSAFVLMVIPIVLFHLQDYLFKAGYLGDVDLNPWKWMIFLSHGLPDGRYTKGAGDFVFIAYHIIFWSFVRQFVTIYILTPLAKALGIRGNKIMRFTEQGYAIFYFGVMGTFGILVMRDLPTWWYKTAYFWIDYPHRAMTRKLKAYYLLQAAYWCQQTIILALRIEKPRKDFKELVAHHIVTLWLIGWSYGICLTYIGVSVFVTMDISDIFLALAKCVNYVNEDLSPPFFVFFIGVWSYMRHYLNWKILWSVVKEFDLIPVENRTVWRPWDDMWMVWWMKWQIFTPIFLLQCINLFWYFLIWRILFRIVFFDIKKDERSDDEEEEEEEEDKTIEGADKAE